MANEIDKSCYVESLIKKELPFFSEYEEKNRKREYEDLQPAILSSVGALLSILIKATKSKRILEIGTSVGYSTHWLALAAKSSRGKVTTIDNHERTSVEAKSNFKKSKIERYINFIVDDCTLVLPKFKSNSFDFIFLDCSKAIYLNIYDDLARILRGGGILAVDDVLFSYLQNARESQKEKITAFNKRLFDDARFSTTTLDVGHGLTIAYKEK